MTGTSSDFNLVLSLEVFFKRIPNEESPPLIYRDASSYERLKSTWTDSRTLPPLDVLETHWREEGKTIYDTWLETINNPITEQDVMLAELAGLVFDLSDTVQNQADQIEGQDLGLAVAWGTILDLMIMQGMSEEDTDV